jgi:hypothetical protein
MKKISDYVFYDSWQLKELDLRRGNDYVVSNDLGDLKKGKTVRFVGFDDVDNHYGVFVFTDSEGVVLEVSGDFSGSEHVRYLELKQALNKA